MAARFWIGGTGNWSDTAHWSLTTGGTGGQSAPVNADDASFDANSGGGTCTVDIAAQVKNLTCTGYTGSFAETAGSGITITTGGSLTLGSTMSGNGAGNLDTGFGGNGTITFNGKALRSVFYNSASSITTLTIADNSTVIFGVTHLFGNLTVNGTAHSWGSFACNNSNTRKLTLGSNIISITTSAFNAADFGTSTGFSIDPNTATLRFTGGGGINVAASINWNGMSLSWINGGIGMGIYGSNGNIFNALLVVAAAKTDVFQISNSHTFSGQVQFQGTDQSTRLLVKTNSGLGSGGSTATATITNNGSWGTNQYTDFQDITIAGTAGNLTGTLIGDALGNTGITFTVSAQQTWQGTSGGNWSDGTKWTSRVPLPQDDVVINAAFTSTQTITADMPRLARSIDFTGVSGNPNFNHSSITTAIFGNLTFAAGMSHSTGQHFQLKGRGAFTLTSAGKGWGFDIDVIAPGGSYTLLDDLPGNAEILHIAGTFDANNHNVTIADFISTSTLTRTVNMGTGTWTLIGTSTVWQVAAAGLTLNKSTSIIAITDTSGSAKSFIGGGFSYPTLRFTPTGPGTLNITGNNTFVNFDVEYSSGASVTVSGNEITDTNRIAALSWGTNQQGGSTDGLGLYENRILNGNFEANTTGWNANGLNTITRSTTVAEVGAWSALGTYNNGVAGDSNVGAYTMGTLVAGTYTVGAWIYMPSGYSGTASGARPRLSVEGFTGITGTQSTEIPNVANSFQFVSITFTLSGSSSGFVVFRAGNNGAPVNGNFFYYDGVMLEAGSIAHAYVDHFGVSTPNGYGIWEAGTNSFRYGQCGSIGGGSGADWNIISAGVTVPILDATVAPPFSPQSVKVTTDGTAASQAISPKSASGQAMAVGTNVATSIYFKGVAGASYTVQSRIVNTDATTTDATNMGITATGAWQLLIPNTVAVAAGKIGDAVAIRVGINGTRAESFWVAHPMLQIGVTTVSPYVATSAGVTATRNAARIQSAVRNLNATQGGFAIRIKMGFSSADPNPHGFIMFGDSSSNYVRIYFPGGVNGITVRRIGGGTSAFNQIAATWAIGDILTIFMRYDGTTIAGSINGVAFSSVSSTAIPTLATSTFDIGSDGTIFTNVADSAVLWALGLTGTPSDADAATLSALSNSTAPSINTLPASAGISFIWNGLTNSTSYFPGRILTLPAGGTQTITGLLTFTGISGQQLSVMSSTPGTSSTIQMASGSSISFTNHFLSSDIILNQVKSGGAIIHTLSGGSERKLNVETSGGKTKSFAGATEKSTHVERGGGLTKLFTGATEKKLYVKSSGGINKTVAGARMFAYSISIGGAKTKVYSGATSKGLSVHNGGAVLKTFAGSTEDLKFIEVSGGILASVSGGGELFVGKHHGGAALTIRAGGSLRIVRVSGVKDFLLEAEIDRPVLIGARRK